MKRKVRFIENREYTLGVLRTGELVITRPPGGFCRDLIVWRDWCSVDDSHFKVPYETLGAVLEAREDVDSENILWYRVLFPSGPGWIMSENLDSA